MIIMSQLITKEGSKKVMELVWKRRGEENNGS
jgi:hypothetical protein